MKSFMAKAAEVDRKWYVIDATDKVLGRLASEISINLKGKKKHIYNPHVYTGDFVIVINADKVKLTGNKWDQKVHVRHTGYPGGRKEVVYSQLRDKHPERIVEYAVKGMLPKNRLGRKMYTKLKVYAGEEHPHQAQQPEVYEF
ncbi:MAG: 50S ribosomal protein L13 [Peptoniphilus sp.]|nr:50S ribosomal protein L13 [Peptoniphilus sp.]